MRTETRVYSDDKKKLLKAFGGSELRSVTHDKKGRHDELVFEFADGKTMRLETEADCCSSTWIEHLTVPDDIDGATLVGIEDCGEWGEAKQTIKDHPEHDCLQIYETRFRTTRGDVVCEYRNASNGYYGGDLRPVWK